MQSDFVIFKAKVERRQTPVEDEAACLTRGIVAKS